MDSSAPSVHPQQALAVYAEPLVVGSRVVVFGDSSLGLGARLLELGARSVQLVDPDPARARAEADRVPRGVGVHVYDDFDADGRGFDLGIVIDLGAFDDPASVVRRVRRGAGENGVALFAAKSAEVAQPRGYRAFDYYDLFDLVAPEFESVRMVAQLPFHGVSLVELGEEDESPAVNVDMQLAESGRVPEAFVVVASQHGARVAPYAIVQLPPPVQAIESVDSDALAQAELRSELLASQLDDLRARMEEGARAADELPALEDTLRARTARVAELERALAARGRDVADLSNEVEEMRAAAEAGRIAASQVEDLALRADRAERRAASLEEDLKVRVDRAEQRAVVMLEELTLRADRAERRAAALEGELASILQELAGSGDAHALELARVEEGLRERAQALRLLESEVALRDQIVRELVGRLEENQDTSPQGFPPPEPSYASEAPPAVDRAEVNAALERARAAEEAGARLGAQLDALALDLARREGESQASAWKVTELERQLVLVQEELSQAVTQRPRNDETEATSPQAASPQADESDETELTDDQLAEALTRALDEADSLRTALAQEHEVRKRLESGEELSRARVEIERQAVLLEQLARDTSRPITDSGEFFASSPKAHEDSR
jgi:hypothetical protein